jgi:hypothetical protein
MNKEGTLQHNLLINSLKVFYQQQHNLLTVSPIILKNDKISLRLIDWFVTNYSKNYNVVIPRPVKIGNKTTVEYFNVYQSYRDQLKAYTKQWFDPFRRRSRIEFMGITTTIGQLAFFRWAIQNNIISYLRDENNFKNIEKDMNSYNKKSTGGGSGSSGGSGSRRKLQQQDLPPKSLRNRRSDIQKMTSFSTYPTTVHFD